MDDCLHNKEKNTSMYILCIYFCVTNDNKNLTCCFAATLTTLWLKGMFFIMKNHFCPCFITVDTTETVNRTDRCRIVYMSVCCTHFRVCEMDRRRRRVENTCIFQSNNISSVYHLFVGNERCKIYCFYGW